VVKWRNEERTRTTRLERRSALARLGTVATRVEAERHRRGARREQRGGESMGQTGEGGGKRRITAPCSSGAADEVGCPATGAVARAAQPRSRGVWLSGAGVDDGPCRPGHQARVWGQLSSRPLQSPAASHQLQCAEARAA